MKLDWRIVVIGLVAVGITACATQDAARPGAVGASPSKATPIDVAKTAESMRGNSKADVIAALGPATVVRFDSGYEVWVYRFAEGASGDKPNTRHEPPGRPNAKPSLSELVLLITPAGIVSKVRIRAVLAG